MCSRRATCYPGATGHRRVGRRPGVRKAALCRQEGTSPFPLQTVGLHLSHLICKPRAFLTHLDSQAVVCLRAGVSDLGMQHVQY